MANDTTASGNNKSASKSAGTEKTAGGQQPGGQSKHSGEHKMSAEQQQLVEQKWNQIRSAIKAKWTQLTDEDLKMIDGDSRKLVALVHQKTNLPLHEIEEGIDQIAAASEGLLSRIARAASDFAQSAGSFAQSTASDFAQGAGSFAQSAGSQVSAPVQRVYTQARELVEARPLPSVASAFAAGLLVGILTYALSAEER